MYGMAISNLHKGAYENQLLPTQIKVGCQLWNTWGQIPFSLKLQNLFGIVLLILWVKIKHMSMWKGEGFKTFKFPLMHLDLMWIINIVDHIKSLEKNQTLMEIGIL